MTIYRIKQALRRLQPPAEHLCVYARCVEAGAITGGIVRGMALFMSAMPVISLLGAIWFLVIQPALH